MVRSGGGSASPTLKGESRPRGAPREAHNGAAATNTAAAGGYITLVMFSGGRASLVAGRLRFFCRRHDTRDVLHKAALCDTPAGTTPALVILRRLLASSLFFKLATRKAVPACGRFGRLNWRGRRATGKGLICPSNTGGCVTVRTCARFGRLHWAGR